VVLLEQVRRHNREEVDCKVQHLLLAHSPLVAVEVEVASPQQPMGSLAVQTHQYMVAQVLQVEMVEAQATFGMHITMAPEGQQQASELGRLILLR
jgi:hypothetical protein